MDLKELLETSVKHNASDLHLSEGLPPMIRADGEMYQLPFDLLDNTAALSLLEQLMTKNQQQDFKQKRELDFAIELNDMGRFRVNAFMQSRGFAAVLRTIPQHIPTLASINAPKIFEAFANLRNGLVLITGATGSGKSTTLAAIIDSINSEKSKHILTIEDPIEFVHTSKKSLVNQREVHRDTHSFNQALRSALREDPDVILVGELRDQETISLALTAAETGHLVFATLHTSSAPKTINRIIDVFAAGDKPMIRSMLSGSLRAVVSQQLFRKKQGGRVAAHEIMLVNTAIRNLIREDKIAQMVTVMQTGGAQGMQTMEQAVHKLKAQGEIISN